MTDTEVGDTNEPLQVEQSKVGRSEGGMWVTRGRLVWVAGLLYPKLNILYYYLRPQLIR